MNAECNFFFELLKLDENLHNIIPNDWSATQCYTFSYKVSEVDLLPCYNEISEIIEKAKKEIDAFIDIYKEAFAFTQPKISFHASGLFEVKIYMMENEMYEYLMKNYLH